MTLSETLPKRLIRYRRRGLPKRLMRIRGGVPGLVAACNVEFAEGYPAAKVAFFKNRKAMRSFYRNILPKYRGMDGIKSDPLGTRCAGCVNKLAVIWEKTWPDESSSESVEIDARYFCIVLLVEGDLTAEIIAHEAVHVGFAWNWRTRGESPLADADNAEENVCYPAGIFVDQVLSFIKREGLREV